MTGKESGPGRTIFFSKEKQRSLPLHHDAAASPGEGGDKLVLYLSGLFSGQSLVFGFTEKNYYDGAP
ncbi:hypothetical protein NP233_g9640 [Leucocoprinus birnbaumii]|uniref:Uncharacterized protein n=1 Tax=Leucocoprinus birnbaumii TaxID=56174 RepID=A0AAD5YQN2_9AGAR|nr:hypothetical protein NP233_g9640 [Leucocoprinus birnbaumii]